MEHNPPSMGDIAYSRTEDLKELIERIDSRTRDLKKRIERIEREIPNIVYKQDRTAQAVVKMLKTILSRGDSQKTD